MKIAAMRADNSGCAYYRIKEPARAAMDTDPSLKITVDTGIDVTAIKVRADSATRVTEIKEDVDLIIVQRPLAQHFTSMIEQAHRQGIAVVVELDDDFEHVHKKNTVWANVQPDMHQWSNYEWLKRACELADHVTVSTKALKSYAPHGRVSVIGNYISRRNISTHKLETVVHRPARIGWSGTVATHPTDLQVTKPAVNQVLRDTKSEFVTVGDGMGVREGLGLAKSIPMQTTGWIDTDDYIETLCGSMDLGIVPLDLTPFNEAKSHLKGLEYAACGIPFVASPTAEYIRLAETGIGELARNPSEWRRILTKYLSSEDLRLATGEANRAILKERYLLENHVREWTTAWETAINYRKSCTTA